MKKFLSLLMMALLCVTTAWAETVTLTNADIVAAGAAQDGYRSWSITDANGKVWNAYAIKKWQNQQTAGQHALQIRKYASSTAYYIQVPAYGTKITRLVMTVSSTSTTMNGGGNNATLFFSAYNSTSSTGDGVAYGTGQSSVTIDCSSLNLNTGYITANGAVRIWEVTVTYETSAAPYTISYGTPTNGLFASENPTSAIAGSSVTIATTPADGYALSAVTVDPSANVSINGNNASFTMPASNVTVNASFSALYGITVTNGTASPTSAYEGQTVTLTPTIPNGKVVDWDNTTVDPATVVINHSNYTFTMPAHNVTVVFAFKDAPTFIFNTTEGITALGLTPPTSSGTNLSEDESYTSNGVTMTTTHGSTKTRIWYNATTGYDLRVYGSSDNHPAAGTLTFTVPDGNVITKMDFTYNQSGGFTVNSGTFNTDYTEWTGSAQSVTLTAVAQSQITTINVYYSASSNNLYIIGHVNQYVPDDWTYTDGVKMTYDETTQTYSKNIYITGANKNENYGWIQLSSALGPKQTLITNKNLYGSGDLNGGQYWGLSETLNTDVALYKESQTSYRLAPGLYTITADLNHGPEGNQYTNCKIRAQKNTATISFSEESGSELASGSQVTITSNLAELSGSNSVVIEYSTDDGNTWTAGTTATLTASCTLKARAYIPGSSLVPSKEGMFLKVDGEASYTIYQEYSATIANGITGGYVAFNAEGTTTTLNNIREGNEVRVYVTPYTDYELTSLTYTVENSGESESITNNAGDYYTFSMPASNVTINATFTYNGTATQTNYILTNKLVPGAKYLIVNENAQEALGYGGSTNSAIEISINNHQTTISGDSPVAQFVLEESSTGVWKFKNGDNYLKTTDKNNGITISGSGSNAEDTWSIEFDEDNAIINNGNYTSRVIRYYSDDNTHNFRTYKTDSGSPVQLYQEVVEADLADIEASNAEGMYTVNDDLQVVYIVSSKDVAFARALPGTTVSCLDGTKDFMRDVAVGDLNDHQDGPWQKSNWVMLDFTNSDKYGLLQGVTTKQKEDDPASYHVVIPGGTLKGVYSNYTIQVSNASTFTSETVEACGTGENQVKPYVPNVYSPANFYVDENNTPTYIQRMQSGVDEDTGEPIYTDYWFMTPQVMELCKFTWAMYYDGEYNGVPYAPGFYMQEGETPLMGGISADMSSYNSVNTVQLTSDNNGEAYRFLGVIMPKTRNGGQLRNDPEDNHPQGGSTLNPDFKVAAVNFDPEDEDQVITAVSEVKTGSDVVSVTYCDLAGRMSQKPFAGVNIIVTRYSDGTVKTTKAIK